ncbi:MAG: phosphoserine transaminase [Methylococcales bacterium]
MQIASLSANQLNFSGGPGALPESVLQKVQESINAVPEVGLSILGISHRSDWFQNIVSQTEKNIKSLLGLDAQYHILFLQGGATQQFSMIPLSFLEPGQTADYLNTGYWSTKSIQAPQYGQQFNTIWSGQSSKFNHLPHNDNLNFNTNAAYFHYTSNETVEGIQFQEIMGLDSVPRICDMSSDFLSKPVDAQKFDLIYAHAQKNIGPAGVTVVIIKDSLLQQANPKLPGFLNYATQIKHHSVYNTPPVFSIYVVHLITQWLIKDIGGLTAMGQLNNAKAQTLYDFLDHSHGFYQGHALQKDRSMMNVVFNLPSSDLKATFLNEAQKLGLSGLNGHRSIGGIRASLYNGLSLEAVEQLILFMRHFQNKFAG